MVVKIDKAGTSAGKTHGPWEMVVKQTDQLTPLHVTKLPRAWQVFCVLMTGACFLCVFGWVIYGNTGARCTTENGCDICVPSLSKTKGQTCAPLSTMALDIGAGCMRFSLQNNYSSVDQTMRWDHSGFFTSDPRYSSDASFKAKADRVLTSIKSHELIWDCFSQNTFGQIQDPNQTCVGAWTQKYYAGNGLRYDPNSKDLIPGALKLMSSLYAVKSTISTLVGSEQYSGTQRTPESAAYRSELLYFQEHVSSRYWEHDNHPNYLFTYLVVYGASYLARSPSGDIAAMDPGLATLGAEYSGSPSYMNSLGKFKLMIPINYIQSEQDLLAMPNDPHFSTVAATMEFVPFFPMSALVDRSVSKIEGQDIDPEHCPSASVFAGTPASLFSGTYECCQKKSTSVIISEANALATFAITVSAIFLAGCMLVAGPPGATGQLEASFEAVAIDDGQMVEALAE